MDERFHPSTAQDKVKNYNTPGITVKATTQLQFLNSGCYSINLIQGRWHFQLLKLDHLKSIGKFEFSNYCALWTSWLSQQFLRIYWSRIRPYS
jgi:hypothetical protein